MDLLDTSVVRLSLPADRIPMWKPRLTRGGPGTVENVGKRCAFPGGFVLHT